AGFETLGRLLAERADMAFENDVTEAVLRPLHIEPRWLDPLPASAGLHATLDELLRFAQELLSPTLIAPETLAEATSVQFPGLAGVLPDVGRFDPLDWGLGFELKDRKEPHWTGRLNSPRTFGHFGGSGTFLWVDPEAGVALVCLSDHGFGPWALEAWLRLSDAVVGSDPVTRL
ncbi:MAG: serine hydrolase, partial [Thermoleophilia bacterium]